MRTRVRANFYVDHARRAVLVIQAETKRIEKLLKNKNLPTAERDDLNNQVGELLGAWLSLTDGFQRCGMVSKFPGIG